MKREIPKLVADGLYIEAVSFYCRNHAASLRADKFTFPFLFKACGRLQATSHGQMLHAHLIKTGFCADVYASTALTDMCIKLRRPDDALKVFNEMPEWNSASFNALISGFLKSGYYDEALRVLKQVSTQSVMPNSVTIASLLSVCECLTYGHQIHCWAVKLGVETEVYAATSLVTMYSSCKQLVSATKVFESIEIRNIVSYNAYISGILQNGVPLLVLDVFKDIRRCSDESPNSVTLISVLSACSSLLFLRFGRQIHGIVHQINMGFETKVGTALVDMYSKCGHWNSAYKVFDELNGSRNLVTWNSMIAGMMLNGQSENAIELFMQLDAEGMEPDSATWNSMICGFSRIGKDAEALLFFRKMQSAGAVPSLKSLTSLLAACSALSALQVGKEIHGHIFRLHVCKDEYITTALVDMYMKCGITLWAQRTFDQSEMTRSNNSAIWNAMIAGYGRNDEIRSAFRVFDLMVEEKIQPNEATFIITLSICSHNGLVDKGWQIFRMMGRDHGLSPTPEHFSCMIDLLGRSGWLNEAQELLQELPEPTTSAYASLLNASVNHSDIKLGEEMAKKLLVLEPENPVPYVVLANIYSSQGRWRDAESIRERLNSRGLEKLPALSSIAVT